MLLSDMILRIIIALVLGSLIGLKNQVSSSHQETRTLLGGFRSYALLSLLGVISGILYLNHAYIPSGILSAGVVLIILIYYAEGAFVGKALGITDETTALFAHFIGFLAISNIIDSNLLVALAMVVVFVVTRKKQIHAWSTHISEQEVAEFSLFAILALVVLPFLPNQSFSLADSNLLSNEIIQQLPALWQRVVTLELLNPFSIWLIVVVISGLNLLGYVLSKFISSKNSVFISALLGGIVSSTSTTVALAIKSKEVRTKEQVQLLVAAALGAASVSAIQTFLLTIPLSGIFVQAILPSTIVFAGGFMAAALYLRWHFRDASVRSAFKQPEKILSLGPIIQFTMILAVVQIVSKVAVIFVGNTGVVVTSLLAATTGHDAATVSLASLTQNNVITVSLAYATFMGVYFVNILSKIFYSYESGTKYFASQLALYSSIVTTAAIAVGLVLR